MRKSIPKVSFIIIILFSSILMTQIAMEKNNKIINTRSVKNKTFIALFQNEKELEYFLRTQKNFEVLHTYKLIPAALVKPKNGLSIEELTKNYHVKLYENREFKLAKFNVYNNIEMKSEDTAKSINADDLWKKGLTGKGVIVGIIDSGVDKSHPDLKDAIAYEKSFVLKKYGYESDDLDPTDEVGHGTMVAGIIAGRGVLDNNYGLGIAYESKIMNAKVFPEEGIATDAAILAALDWCVFGDDGKPNTGDEADVINMSLGGSSSFIDPLILAVERAVKDYGVVIVVAAGNEGAKIWTMTISSPGIAPSVITVGAVSVKEKKPFEFTSLGPTHYFAVKPDISAPGLAYAPRIKTGYYLYAGTSVATPHVSGVVAQLIQYLKNIDADKSLYPGAIKAALMATATRIPYYADLSVGAGLINALSAYNELESTYDSVKKEFNIVSISPKFIPTGTYSTSPFFPYFEKIFIDQQIVFNFTIVSGFSGSFTISFEGNITNGIDVLSPLNGEVSAGTNYFEFKFKGKNTTLGYYEGNITFSFSNGMSIKVPMEYYLLKPKYRMAFDMKHTSWTIDFAYGQFRYFASFMVSNNVSIEHILHNDNNYTVERLKKYDIIFIPDAASPSYYRVNNETFVEYAKFTKDEILALKKYVEEGGNIIVIGMANTTNFTNLSELTKMFGVKFSREEYTGIVLLANVIKGHLITRGLTNLPMWGRALKINRTLAYPIATLEDKPVYALHVNENGGTAFILGTNFVFDNAAFRGEYNVSSGEISTFFKQYLDLIEKAKLFKLKSVQFNPSSPKLGEEASVSVEFSSVGDAEVYATDAANEHLIGTAKAGDNVVVSGKYTLSLGGAQGVSIQIDYAGDGNGIIDFRVPVITAGKTETEPPVIESRTPNKILLENLKVLEIIISIKDNFKLKYIYDLIDVYVSVLEANVTIENISENEVNIRILIPEKFVETVLSEGKGNFTVKVSAYDVNMNYSEQEIVYVIEKFPFTLVYATVIVAVIIAVGLVLWLKKFRKKKESAS